MDVGKTMYVADRDAWRRWLEKHHASEPEIWLVYPKKGSEQPRIPYNDAVEEALCYGWIDSILKPIDDGKYAQRFTPRRPKSPLSPMNRERVLRLQEEGRMTPAGVAAVGRVEVGELVLPDDIRAALQADEQTWRNFEAFPESYKRIRVGWIDMARQRPDVFKQRLDYFVKMTAANKRFGMVQ
jgi:uncharacterized protein YdeI (YjbR/CyaY-like superfamily)